MSRPSTVLAMHQPNYLPWIGYFDKMRRADVFVLLDCVQYPRARSVANRTRIRTAHGEHLLTVPVSTPGGLEGKASYAQVSFADGTWRRKHLRTIEQAYRRAPHFAACFPELERIVLEAESFCTMNVLLVRWIAGRLGISTPTPLMSELGEEFGPANELIVGLCQATGAGVYLSGTWARAYNDPQRLAAAGIELRYQQFQHPVYDQTGEGFLPNLSAIDLLFNQGGWVEPADEATG
ncbi:MAG: WbqC family protein [Gaiellales bacterium]